MYCLRCLHRPSAVNLNLYLILKFITFRLMLIVASEAWSRHYFRVITKYYKSVSNIKCSSKNAAFIDINGCTYTYDRSSRLTFDGIILFIFFIIFWLLMFKWRWWQFIFIDLNKSIFNIIMGIIDSCNLIFWLLTFNRSFNYEG